MNYESHKNRYLVVVFGIIFNLAIGVLYSWSIIKTSLIANYPHTWNISLGAVPYSVAIFFYALFNLIGGRIYDTRGPKVLVSLGGFLVALGLFLSSFFVGNFILVVLFFGVITGTGLGLSYSCLAPCALKWFHESEKGLIEGLVLGAFGFSAAIFAPLSSLFLHLTGGNTSLTLLFLSIYVFIFTFIASRFIRDPLKSYVPLIHKSKFIKGSNKYISKVSHNYSLRHMIHTKVFYLMILIFFFGTASGLMVIVNIGDIFHSLYGGSRVIPSFVLVAFFAIFNGIGRIIGGLLSDRIGRAQTLLLFGILQFILLVSFIHLSSLYTLLISFIVMGFSYGSFIAVVPVMCADNYGLKHYGRNYGIIYLFWGLGGLIAPILGSNVIVQRDGVYDFTNLFILGSILTSISIICILILIKIGPVKDQALKDHRKFQDQNI